MHTYLQASVLLVITGVDYRTTCNAVMLFPCWNNGPLETMRPITDILTKNICEKPEHAHISYVSDRYFHDTWEWSLTVVFIFNDSSHLVKKNDSQTFFKCARQCLLNCSLMLINKLLCPGKFSWNIRALKIFDILIMLCDIDWLTRMGFLRWNAIWKWKWKGKQFLLAFRRT